MSSFDHPCFDRAPHARDPFESRKVAPANIAMARMRPARSPLRLPLVLLLATLTAPAFTGPVQAQTTGDAAAGEKIFKRCVACHSVEADGKAKIGPNLHGVVGRVSGTAEGFSYSKAMAALGAEGHVWTPEEIEKFLENPKGLVPGTKMAFAGLKKPQDRADVVAYLASLAPAEAPAATPEAGGEPAADPAAGDASTGTTAP